MSSTVTSTGRRLGDLTVRELLASVQEEFKGLADLIDRITEDPSARYIESETVGRIDMVHAYQGSIGARLAVADMTAREDAEAAHETRIDLEATAATLAEYVRNAA